MKIKHYNDAIDWLTRPKFNGGGSVKNKEVLPKRKPEEELKKRKKKRFEKLKEYLENPEEVEEMLELQDGGLVQEDFIDLYEKFPGGSDLEFSKFIENETGVKLKPKSINERRRRADLKIKLKKGQSLKGTTPRLTDDQMVSEAKKLGIDTKGKTIEQIRRSVRSKRQVEKIKSDPEYRQRRLEQGKKYKQKIIERRRSDPEFNLQERIKIRERRQRANYKGKNVLVVPHEMTPKGLLFKDLTTQAFRNQRGLLPDSHIKFKNPDQKRPTGIAKAKEVQLIDTKVLDADGQPKVITYDNVTKHIDDNQRLYGTDSKSTLAEYDKKITINKSGLRNKFNEVIYGESYTSASSRGKQSFAPFHVHHPAGRANNAFNIQFAVGSDNMKENGLRASLNNEFKNAKTFGEKRKAVKKYLDNVPKNLEVRLKRTPYGVRETLTEVTRRVSPELSKQLSKVAPQLNAKLPIISTMYDVAKSIPGDIGKAKYLSAGFKTLGLAVAPYVAYTTFQDVAAGKNLVEALERNLIGTDIIGGTKDILAMSPEEREARAKVKQEQIAELNIDMPTGFGFIEAPPVQTDMSLEEAKQKFEAGKQRVAKERAETEAGVAAMRKQAFDNLKDTVTGNRAMAVELAGGGLLKQAGKRSGPPPEKGPGGLASLEDYARTMME